MSEQINENDPCLNEKEIHFSECNLVEKIILPRKKDLGGFEVSRIFPVKDQRKLGPWIFFDHMGPADFKPGQGINVRPHPHINLATVTYTFCGEIFHRDSLGNSEPILPGELNLMVAGKGIVHSERTRDELIASGQKINGLQLWLALPEDMEETEPDFLHYSKEDIPQTIQNDVPVRVMIGEAYGVKSPVKQFASTLYLEARLQCGQVLELPQAEERGVYVVEGKLKVGMEQVEPYHMAILRQKSSVIVEALEDSLIVVIGGEKMNKRFIEWNFVSSRRERIDEAIRDWSNGHFPKVPGDENEFIPYP